MPMKGRNSMGLATTNKTISTGSIDCGGDFTITLSLSAEPDIVSNPTDIVMILDRSGSMAGSSLANLKNGAKKFIEIIDEATDSTQDGHIGGGSRIGIVSFASAATVDAQLKTSVAELDAAVDALSAGGFTNHEAAFSAALDMFDMSSSNAKVMVMFTDGETTTGGDPVPVTVQAKSQGVIIYCIGLQGNGGLDENALNSWASSPPSAYVSIAPSDEELEKVFEDLAKNISKPGATDIVIEDTLNPCFTVTGLHSPTKGSASITSAHSVRWTIDELGVSGSEGTELTINVEHTGSCTGTVEVNESLSYSDSEGNTANFPSPEIAIKCGIVVIPEPCPEPVCVTMNGCESTLEFDAGYISLNSLGRILKADVTLMNVCPNRRVALAAILSELDCEGREYQRGIKILTIPAHDSGRCADVTVRCIRFVLPEELSPHGGSGMCHERSFRLRFIANYIDLGFECCTLD